jgi:hypothetical protein
MLGLFAGLGKETRDFAFCMNTLAMGTFDLRAGLVILYSEKHGKIFPAVFAYIFIGRHLQSSSFLNGFLIEFY